MTARFLTHVKVRTGPSISAEAVATYNPGETVNYDNIVDNERRKWISYIGRSGNRRYCCAIDSNGEKYIELGNNSGGNDNISMNQKNSRHLAVRKLFFMCMLFGRIK